MIFENREDSHALIIKNVSLADEIEYKALARNPLGTVSCSAELLVEESVSKPELIEPMMDVQVCAPPPCSPGVSVCMSFCSCIGSTVVG